MPMSGACRLHRVISSWEKTATRLGVVSGQLQRNQKQSGHVGGRMYTAIFLSFINNSTQRWWQKKDSEKCQQPKHCEEIADCFDFVAFVRLVTCLSTDLRQRRRKRIVFDRPTNVTWYQRKTVDTKPTVCTSVKINDITAARHDRTKDSEKSHCERRFSRLDCSQSNKTMLSSPYQQRLQQVNQWARKKPFDERAIFPVWAVECKRWRSAGSRRPLERRSAGVSEWEKRAKRLRNREIAAAPALTDETNDDARLCRARYTWRASKALGNRDRRTERGWCERQHRSATRVRPNALDVVPLLQC